MTMLVSFWLVPLISTHHYICCSVVCQSRNFHVNPENSLQFAFHKIASDRGMRGHALDDFNPNYTACHKTLEKECVAEAAQFHMYVPTIISTPS